MAREGIEPPTRGFSGSGRVVAYVLSNVAEVVEVPFSSRLNLPVGSGSFILSS